jgi:hypothetical protein
MKISVMNIIFFLNSISQADEPQNFEIEKHNPNWCKMMDEEFHVLEKKSNMGNIFSTKK